MRPKYQNEQLWCECQLVALWNAYRFFGKEPPDKRSEIYRIACVDGSCINGACINIDRERKRLGLVFTSGCYKLNWVRKNLPVHLGLFTKHRGYHSVLVVEVHRNKLLLVNYSRGRLYWMSWKRIFEMANKRVEPYSYGLRNRRTK